MRTLAIVLVLVMLAGCGESGPPLAPVKGKVTLNGQPYTKGTVVFQPSGGGPTGIGMTDVNGDYSVWTSGRKGAPLGPHTVMVTTIADPSATQVAPAEMRSDDPRYADQANSEAADYVKAAKKTPQDPIPAKYNKNSELRYTVESGGGEFNIDIVK